MVYFEHKAKVLPGIPIVRIVVIMEIGYGNAAKTVSFPGVQAGARPSK
jgi:hypothetical protein